MQKRKTPIISNTIRTDSTYLLTESNRSILFPVMKNDDNYKFIEFTIGEVSNPGRYHIAFEVNFQQKDKNEKIFLSTFSSYPAGNSGRFLVATKGLLKNDGNVELTFLLPEDLKKTDSIRIKINSIKLRKQ